MPTIDFNEDECTLLLVGLENLHVSLQGGASPDDAERMEAINRLEEKIKEAEDDNWQLIGTAPKDKTRILVAHKWGVDVAVYLPRKEIWVAPNGSDGYEPTHWQPLPPPPATAKG